MPNPALIYHKGNKVDHHLKLVDFYISVGCPPEFFPEPTFGNYNPDAYTIDRKGTHACVELQLTPISTKRMQEKVEQFIESYGKHKARILLLVSDKKYPKLDIPKDFSVQYIPVPKEIEY